jgi:hypothetical protein
VRCQSVLSLDIAAVPPPPAHLAIITSTSHQTSLYIEFLAHSITELDPEPDWLHSLNAVLPTHQQHAVKDSSQTHHPPNADNGRSQLDSSLPFHNGCSGGAPEGSGTPPMCTPPTTYSAEQPAAHLTPWLCPVQPQEGHLDIRESDGMAPDAGSMLQPSSAAAVDALHSILVQVAMSKGEDTTTFVKLALTDPSVMQVLFCPFEMHSPGLLFSCRHSVQ